ncbi:epimerase [Candidatus Beckwithbacteria bacterium RBG_13_42_9]|uniref:Epimerase n=1 Tax=Candidatus Beckwithbacteria bacterium RBG_13_42_9 TaxID=1797457 RepID=A0A1F5E7F6_9BACT|nr:MAG: epimerase [Candidatus Beckwithbacteria bacterium RBG_13_42_9]
MTKPILVTGGAGFIGSSLIEKLIQDKDYLIICVDDLNDYYDPQQKQKNIAPFLKQTNFIFYKIDITDYQALKTIFQKHKLDKIIHLAARAGVRASINQPLLYKKVNVGGTLNLLELARINKTPQFIFGSTSSVYGNQKKIPFSEADSCNEPISPYAASKKAAELFCHTYAHLHGLKITCLRFFTVYGPKGRPDMAPYLFTEAIVKGKSIERFGDGTTKRDYTYIDDIVDGIIKTLQKPFNYEIINLGSNQPISLNEFIKTLEKLIGKKAQIIQKTIPCGDVLLTYADIKKARILLGWKPTTNFESGMRKFVTWYCQEVAKNRPLR